MPIQEFLKSIELESIRNIERVGRVLQDPQEGDYPKGLDDVYFNHFEWGERIVLGFGLSAKTEDVLEVSVKVVISYQNPQGLDLSKEDKELFLSDVVFMQVYPYLREGFASMAQQIGVAVPTLGVVQRGQFRIELPESEAGEA